MSKKRAARRLFRVFSVFVLAMTAVILVTEGAVLADETIELGDRFVYESCWSGSGGAAALERKSSSGSTWTVVARTRGKKSKDCPAGYKLYTYRWTPKKLGTYALRERLSNGPGARQTISDFFILTVSPSSTPAYAPLPQTLLPPTGASSGTSSGSLSGGLGGNLGGGSGGRGLLGCYFNGKKLWGSVYFTSSSAFADVTIYFTSSSAFADLNVYSVSSASFASSCGLWYSTSSASFADLTVYVASSSAFADLNVYVTRSAAFAGL